MSGEKGLAAQSGPGAKRPRWKTDGMSAAGGAAGGDD